MKSVRLTAKLCIHCAAERGDLEMVKFLVDRGADINRKTSLWGGETTLQLAVKEGHTGVEHYLRAHGADVYPAYCAYKNRLFDITRNGNFHAVKEIIALFPKMIDESADEYCTPLQYARMSSSWGGYQQKRLSRQNATFYCCKQ